MALKKYNVQVKLRGGGTELISVDAENASEARKKALDLSEFGATAGGAVLVESTSKPDRAGSTGGLTDDAGDVETSTGTYKEEMFDDEGDKNPPVEIDPPAIVPPVDADDGSAGFKAYMLEQDKKLEEQMAAFRTASEKSQREFEERMAQLQAELDAASAEPAGGGGVPPTGGGGGGGNDAQMGLTYQTDESRERQLEGTSPFGAFLEQLENAGLGNLGGAAGRFAKSQYQPLRSEYDLATLMPLIMNEAAGEGTDRASYLDALRRSNTTGGYDALTGDEAALQREMDKSNISKFAPTFGSFVGDRVGGGARSSQLRQLAQLKQLADMTEYGPDNAFASGVLNPESSEDAELLFQLANQGMSGRYSPLAQQAISRYAGSSGEAFADFTRGNLAKVGSLQSSAPSNNFADFLGRRYGLF
jgi:hypothetical protein